MVKLFALAIAIVMSIPASAFAQVLEKTDKSYTEDSSVMGLQDPVNGSNTDPITSTGPVLIKSDITTEETTDYIIEKSASLSKATGLINFRIAVKAKSPSKDEKLSAIFAINENTDLKDIDLTKVTSLDATNKEAEIEANKATPGILENNDSLKTLALTTEKPAYGMVYYLSAKVDDEAMAKLDEQSPVLSLDIALKEKENSIYNNRYSLKYNNQEESQEEGRTVELNRIESLEEVEADHLITGQYKEESTGLFAKEAAQITWTDYILSKDDAEFAYNFDLDQAQSTENSQILLEFFEAKDKGYIQNKSFTQKLPFAESINLQVPAGQIAKISLTSLVADDKAKEFTFNGKTIENPAYKEEADATTILNDDNQDQSSPNLIDDAKEEDSTLEIDDIEQNAQMAGESQTAYPFSIEYNATTSVRDSNGNEITSSIIDSKQNTEIWWDIELNTQAIAAKDLNYTNLYYTLYMGAKDGLKQFKFKASTDKNKLDETGGYTTAGINATYLYQGFGNIAKDKLGETLYIRVKAPLDKDSEVHDQYSLGIRVNPDQNYIDNLLKDFNNDFERLPVLIKWKIGDRQADIYKDRPLNLLDERIVASPNFVKYDIDDNFYFDTTRSITADRISDTRVEWNILDLIRIGEKEDPNINEAKLNPKETKKTTYYYRPNRNGGYKKYENVKEVKTSKGEFFPGTIVAYNFKQEAGANTSYNLDVTLSPKEYLFRDHVANLMFGKTTPTVPLGGWVGAYTYKIPQAEIGDQYLAYNENPFNIMRINQTFEMVQCYNDGNADPTSSGNNKIGLQRIEDPDGPFLWSMMQGNNVEYARENFKSGAKYNKQGVKDELALKDALKRAYYYTNQVIEEQEKDGRKIPRQVEAFLYQKMVHKIVNNKPLSQQYGIPDEIAYTVKNWTDKDTTLTGDELGKYFTGKKSGTNRSIPENERRIKGYDGNALDEAKALAEEAEKRLNASYDNNDWNDNKADSVDLVFYKHNDTRTLQHLITAKVRKPIKAQKITVDGTSIPGVEFTFTNRKTGESVTWTSKEDNTDNPLYLKPGQYYVDETKVPDEYSKLETFLIELKEEEVNPDNGPYPQYGLDIHVNDGYKYSLSILNPETVQKDGSGNPLVTVDNDKLELNIKNEDSNLGSIEFDKTNGKRNLDGATFTLTKITDENNLESVEMVEGKPVYQKTSTGNNGKFTFASIPEGIYKLEETKAPEGYQAIEPLILIATKDEKTGKVTVKFKDETIEESRKIINKAPSTELSFRKVKKEGDKLVPIDSGTGKFRLYSTWTSDESDYDRTVSPSAVFVPKDEKNNIPALEVGEFRFTDLVEGEYILVEVQAPTGFQKPETPFWRVKVIKSDQGLTYEVYRLSDNEKIEPEKIIRGEDEKEGTTFNIENAPRTIDHKFKKYKENDSTSLGEKYTPIDNLKGVDGNPVSFRLYEADYYGLKKNPKDKGILITPNTAGEFELKDLKYSTYYLLEEENPPAGYTKAAPTVLYVEAEAEAQTGKMKVVVRDRTSNTISDSSNIFTGIVDYEIGKKYGDLIIKKTGKSLIENDDRKVGLRRAYFRLYYADENFEPADENFKKVENKDKASYVERVSAGRALTDEKGNPLSIDDLPKDQGIARFENLKPGRYILIEHRGPAGYEKDPDPRYVIVDENGNVTLSKDKKGTFEKQVNEKPYEIFNVDETGFRIPLRITKKDENGSPLSGAQFKARKIIKGEDEKAKYFEEEFDAVSEATGLAGDNYFRELSPGIYELTETRTPRPKGVQDEEDSDYILPEQKWYFKVKRNPEVDDPSSANYMIIDFKFSHTFSKDDAFTKAGKDYNSQDWYGKTIYGTEPVKDNDGKVLNEEFMKLIKLVADDHRSNPARPDAPYKKIDDLEVTNVKKTTEFDFIKADDYSRAIEGAVFTLRKLATDTDGNIQKEKLSGKYKFEEDIYNEESTSNLKEGVTFKDIPAGKYLLEETKAPAGYEKLEHPIIIEFKISPTTGKWEQTLVEDGDIDSDYYKKIISYKSDGTGISQIKNTKAYTKLEFTKVDQGGNVVSLSAFKLEKLDKDGNIDKNFTPQERRNWNNAKFSFENLTEGKYKLTETNPTKYQQPNPTYFDVVPNEDTGKLEIKFEESDPNIKFVDIDNAVDKDNTKETQFINFDKIDFEFTKIGDDEKPLYGAGFTLKKVLTEKPRVVDDQEIDNSKQIKYTENGEVAKGYEELSDYAYYEKARSYSDGKIKFTDLSQGVYELEETNIPNGYQRLNAQRKWIITVEKNDAGDGLEVKYDKDYEKSYYKDDDSYNAKDTNILTIDGDKSTLKNTSNTTDLEFNKVDEKGNVIAKDTRFTLIKLSHDPDDLKNLSKIDSYVDYMSLAEENGIFKVKDLDRGLYILEETKAPQGYKPAERAIVLQLIEGNDGKLGINSYEAEINKDDKGKVTYTRVEDSKQFNYLDNTKKPIEIENEEIPNFVFNKVTSAILGSYENIVAGELEIAISRYDDTTQKPGDIVKTMTFNLKDTKSINRIYLEDENGDRILEDGKYLIKETKAPDGYQMSGRSYLVEISTVDGKVSVKLLKVLNSNFTEIKNDEDQLITDTEDIITDGKIEITADEKSNFQIVNEKPSNSEFMIKKVDASNNETPIANVGFELYDSERKLIKSARTNTSGEIYFTNVADGTYYLKEILPENYQAYSIWTTVVVSNGEVTFTHENLDTDENQEGFNPLKLFAGVMNIFDTSARDITMTNVKPADFNTTNVTPYTIKNYKNPNVEFYKYGVKENSNDEHETEFLSNVEFILQRYDENDDMWKEVAKAISTPFVRFNNLEPGEYRILEPTAPIGYRQPKENEAVKSFIVKEGKAYTKDSDGKLLEINKVNDNKSIINIRPGEGKVSICKAGDDGEALEGVEFELWYYDRSSTIATGTTDENGYLEFTNLPYGRYWLKETKTLPGYILEENIRQVLVTNKSYTVPDGTTGRDVSDQLTINGDKIISTTNSDTVVYPNDAEGLYANISLKVANQTEANRIKPGDTFYLKLTDNLDLDGIGKATAEGLSGMYDIVGKFGILAKAKIIDNRTIKYTFTNYLDNRTLSSDIKASIPVFVDRFAVPNNVTSNNPEKFGIKLVKADDTLKQLFEFTNTNEMEVKYFDKYDVPTKPNINALPLKVDQDTKEFRMLVYLNMDHKLTRDKKYYFRPSVDMNDVKIKVYNMGNQIQLPHSYGINLDENVAPYQYGTVNANQQLLLNVDSSLNDNAYVLELTGKIAGENPSTINTRSWYLAYLGDTNNSLYYYWDTENKFYTPSLESEATPIETQIGLINEKNRIIFLKVAKTNNENSSYDYLQGAEFELRKLNAEGKYVKVADKEKAISDQFGVFGWSKIPQGKYQVWETKAPEGYQIPKEGMEVATFEVDEKGIVKDISKVFIENEKTPQGSLPGTGGAGTFIGFAIVGTAVMLAAIAYFGIYQNNKNRRRSNR